MLLPNVSREKLQGDFTGLRSRYRIEGATVVTAKSVTSFISSHIHFRVCLFERVDPCQRNRLILFTKMGKYRVMGLTCCFTGTGHAAHNKCAFGCTAGMCFVCGKLETVRRGQLNEFSHLSALSFVDHVPIKPASGFYSNS